MGKATLSPTSALLCRAADAVGIHIHQGLGGWKGTGLGWGRIGLGWGRAEQEDKRKRKLSEQRGQAEDPLPACSPPYLAGSAP